MSEKHICLGVGLPLSHPDFCTECYCVYCGSNLLPGAEGRCSDSSCENHWRQPQGRDHRGFVRRPY